MECNIKSTKLPRFCTFRPPEVAGPYGRVFMPSRANDAIVQESAASLCEPEDERTGIVRQKAKNMTPYEHFGWGRFSPD